MSTRQAAFIAFCSTGMLLDGPLPAAETNVIPFTEEAIARGIDYLVEDIGFGASNGYGRGSAIVDLTGNGHQDIILLGKTGGAVGLFENDGTGQFIDRSYTLDAQGEVVPKHILSTPSGIAVADYNGSGMLDIYLTQRKGPLGTQYPNKLLRNNGNFNFTNVADEAGVADMGNGQGAAWGDFDNDGWLDLYVVNFTFSSVQQHQIFRNTLYRNLGDGTFADVSIAQGVDDYGLGFAAAFSDTNRNGWLDLYLANDRGNLETFPTNRFWLNQQGQYEDACDTSGACLGLAAMCVGAGDFNGNGYPDLYVTNMPNEDAYNGWNPLLVNHGDGTFTEQCNDADVCQSILSWAGVFFDFSNNGWLDLYVCNHWEDNNLFANGGTFPVTAITHETNVAGNHGPSYSAAVGDLTGTGALDLLLNNTGVSWEPLNAELFINHEGELRNWIRFNVVGFGGNLHGIGANIEITTIDHTQWREIYAGGNNFKSQNELVFHFGIDEATQADTIVVNWPGGTITRTLMNYPANETWTLYPLHMLGGLGNGNVVNVDTLLGILNAWGPVTSGSEIMDVTGSGIINVDDLVTVLNRWGQTTLFD